MAQATVTYDPQNEEDAGSPTKVFGYEFFPNIPVVIRDLAVARKLLGNPQFRVEGIEREAAPSAFEVPIPIDWATWGAIQKRNLARALNPEVPVNAGPDLVEETILNAIAARTDVAVVAADPATASNVAPQAAPEPAPEDDQTDDGHDPGKIDVPEGWESLHWSKRAAIARAIQPDPEEAISNGEEADAVIRGELIRRGAIEV